MAKTFYAQLKDIQDLVVADMEAVMRMSLQDVVQDMQTPTGEGGRMPVVSSNLRNSTVSEVDGAKVEGPEAFSLAIASMELGDVTRFGYTAEYARRVNSGFVGTDSLGRVYAQGGRHFMDAAAAKFPGFFNQRAKEIRG